MPLIQTQEERVLTIEISRPEKRNTLNAATLEEFTAILEATKASPDVRAVVIAAQPGIFCAGGDLAEQLKALSAADDTPTGRFIATLASFTKPLLACVEGPCVGLGTTILYYCDLVYASRRSLFSLPYTALGLTPRYGISALAVKAAGLHKAAEKLLLSEPISAEEALAMGIVTGLFEDAEVRSQVKARAVRLSKLSPLAVQKTKALLQTARGDLDAVRLREAAAFEEAAKSEAAKEACSAFLEGRKPNIN